MSEWYWLVLAGSLLVGVIIGQITAWRLLRGTKPRRTSPSSPPVLTPAELRPGTRDRVVYTLARSPDGSVTVQCGRHEFVLTRDAVETIAARTNAQDRLCFRDDAGNVDLLLTAGESWALTLGLRRLREFETQDVPSTERPS